MKICCIRIFPVQLFFIPFLYKKIPRFQWKQGMGKTIIYAAVRQQGNYLSNACPAEPRTLMHLCL